jgi:hypothetical protein
VPLGALPRHQADTHDRKETTMGWTDNRDGTKSFTAPGHSWAPDGPTAPELEGWRAVWVTHLGTELTRWTYRPR